LRRAQPFEKDAVFAQDESLLPREREIRPAVRVGGKPRAVGLVGCQALDVVNPVRGGGRALMRAEIADQIRSAASDHLTPVSAILVEGLFLERIDLVADEAGNHRLSSLSLWRVPTASLHSGDCRSCKVLLSDDLTD